MRKHPIKKRRGTAEVVGTTLFLVILLFFFTNTILWYDISARQTNEIMVNRISTPLSMTVYQYPSGANPLTIRVRSMGAKDVRIVGIRWIEAANDNHVYVNLKSDIPTPVMVQSGWWLDIKFVPGGNPQYLPESRTLIIDFPKDQKGEVTFKVLTEYGNLAVYAFTFT